MTPYQKIRDAYDHGKKRLVLTEKDIDAIGRDDAMRTRAEDDDEAQAELRNLKKNNPRSTRLTRCGTAKTRY